MNNLPTTSGEQVAPHLEIKLANNINTQTQKSPEEMDRMALLAARLNYNSTSNRKLCHLQKITFFKYRF